MTEQTTSPLLGAGSAASLCRSSPSRFVIQISDDSDDDLPELHNIRKSRQHNSNDSTAQGRDALEPSHPGVNKDRELLEPRPLIAKASSINHNSSAGNAKRTNATLPRVSKYIVPKDQPLITSYTKTYRDGHSVADQGKRLGSCTTTQPPDLPLAEIPKTVSLPPYSGHQEWTLRIKFYAALAVHRGIAKAETHMAAYVRRIGRMIFRSMARFPDDPRLLFSTAGSVYLGMRMAIRDMTGDDIWTDSFRDICHQDAAASCVSDQLAQSDTPLAQAVGGRVTAEIGRVYFLKSLDTPLQPGITLLHDILSLVLSSVINHDFKIADTIRVPTWDDVWFRACKECSNKEGDPLQCFEAHVAVNVPGQPTYYVNTHTLRSPCHAHIDLPTLILTLAIVTGQTTYTSFEDAHAASGEYCLDWERPLEHIVPESVYFGARLPSSSRGEFSMAHLYERARSVCHSVGFTADAVALLRPAIPQADTSQSSVAFGQEIPGVPQRGAKQRLVIPEFKRGMTEGDIRKVAISALRCNIPGISNKIKAQIRKYEDMELGVLMQKARDSYDSRKSPSPTAAGSPPSSPSPPSLMERFGYGGDITSGASSSVPVPSASAIQLGPSDEPTDALQSCAELNYLRYPHGCITVAREVLPGSAQFEYDRPYPSGQMIPNDLTPLGSLETQLLQHLFVYEACPLKTRFSSIIGSPHGIFNFFARRE